MEGSPIRNQAGGQCGDTIHFHTSLAASNAVWLLLPLAPGAFEGLASGLFSIAEGVQSSGNLL